MANPTICTISPSTNKVVCEVPETTADEARSITRASQDAFVEWSRTSFQQRKDIIIRALGTIQERKMVLGKELTAQMGRPVAFSHKEIETMQKRADYLLETAEEALQSIPGKLEAGFQRWVKKVPIGPVLIIFAWNVSLLRAPSRNFVLELIQIIVSIPRSRQCTRPRSTHRRHSHPQTIASNPPRRPARS